VGIEKAVIDRTDRLILLTCMEVEDENDDEDENDWGRKQAATTIERMASAADAGSGPVHCCC
jgi:hypothetical protein